MPLTVRVIEQRDVEAVLAIQAASPGAAVWNPSDYEIESRPHTYGWVAEDARTVTGFLVARQAADEFEILNIAVSPAFRRQGVASALLSAAVNDAEGCGAKAAYLEVRASNVAAIGLYEQHGFVATGRRKGYYSSPAEDALILSLVLGNSRT